MPLFKLIIQTINQNKKCENIFRWLVKDSMDDITYEQLNERIQSIFYKLDSYNNNNDLMKEFQVLWYGKLILFILDSSCHHGYIYIYIYDMFLMGV